MPFIASIADNGVGFNAVEVVVNAGVAVDVDVVVDAGRAVDVDVSGSCVGIYKRIHNLLLLFNSK